MLTALRIGNFKAFAEAQRIPVRPLTLIYGENSSGKTNHEPREQHEIKGKI
jgi:AAA15 family ATPase/GTPase